MKKAVLLLLVFLTITACAIGGAAEEANQPEEVQETDTPVPPTDTPVPPTETPTATATFTETPTPTEEPTATNTPTETQTPTATQPPGPITYSDDFSSDNGNWENCKVCEWSDGKLWYGPMPPSNEAKAYPTFCKACGTPTYFKMQVDAQFFDGYTDRLFGVIFSDNDDEYYAFAISTIQFYYWYHMDKHYGTADDGYMDWTGMCLAGTAVNTIGVEVIPTKPGYADIYFKLNGKNALMLYNKPIEAGQVGLMLDWHSIGVNYDNFVFEEIWPDWED